MVKQINSKEFEEVTKKGKVFVDCFATWCGPCKMIAPVIDEVSEEVTNYNFYKLDVDESEDIAVKYGIMSIPTMLIFNDGKLVNTIVGLRSKNELIDELK